MVRFNEPDLNDDLTSIALYATPEVRKVVSNLPLLGKTPSITYQSVIAKMMDTPQTKTQTVLEHGISVHRYFKDLHQHLSNDSNLQYNWKLPEWLTEHKNFILENLHDYEIVKEYQLMHDCSKPYCIEYDSEGKVHFPNHAQKSSEIYSKISDNKVVPDLILKDMIMHKIKADEVETFVSNNSVESILTLLVTSLCEVHSNAALFGGIDSTSFKIKKKQIEKRGNQIIKLIMKNQEVLAWI